MKVIKSRQKRIRRLKFVSGIIGLIMFFVVLIHVNMVSAGTQDSRLLKNRKEGVYAVTKLNGVDRLFYLNMYTMNGIPAYCIEIGVDISTDIYDSSTYYGVSGLSFSKAEYVQAVIYYGYKYKNHDDYRYYMAAQEIIWEYLKGISVEWTSEEDFNGSKINIDSYKNEIIRLVNGYYSVIDLDFVDGKDLIPFREYVSNDRNNIVSNYVIDGLYGMEASISGNSVRYKVVDKNNSKVSFTLKLKKDYDYDSKFYTSGNSQKLVSVGNFISKTASFSFNVVKSNMCVKVADMDTKLNSAQGEATLEGAKYKLYKDNVEVLEFITDDLGQACVKDLDAGEYIIKQVSASDGYIVNEKEVVANLKYGNNEVALEERVISNNISIVKYLGNSDRVEEGISFSIYNKNGDIVSNVVTDNLGRIFFNLVYGTYVVSQNNTSYGYKNVTDFTIVVDEVIDEKRVYILNDEEILYNVKISTFDKKSFDKIEKEGFCYKVLDKDSSTYIVRGEKDIFCTNELGEVSIMELGYGKYSIEQVDVIHGYILNNERIDFVVDDSVDNSLISIDFYNEKIIGKINILVEKEVFSEDNFSYDMVPVKNLKLDIYYGDSIINNVSTDDNGKVLLDELELGKYCVSYGNIKKCVDLDLDLNNVLEVVREVKIIIELDKGGVILTNVDDNDNAIEGSIFKLYDDNDKLLYTGKTFEDGTIKVDKLVVGDYCFVQEKVLYGYNLNKEKKCFNIIKNDTVKLKFVNKKSSKKLLSIPDTYVDGSDVFKLLFIISVLIGGFCYKKKIFNM